MQFIGIENFLITTGSGDDTIRTGGGDDTIAAGAGDDILDGGLGTDIAVFGGARQDYAITPNADGSVQVTDQRAGVPDGSDRLVNVDLAQFADETVAINYVPFADDDSYETNKNSVLIVAAPGVLEGDSDANGDTLTAVLVTAPTHGDMTFNADGSFTYTPDADYVGPDAFTYRANDGEADSRVATVTLTIRQTALPPVVDAGADRTAAEGQTVNLSRDVHRCGSRRYPHRHDRLGRRHQHGRHRRRRRRSAAAMPMRTTAPIRSPQR